MNRKKYDNLKAWAKNHRINEMKIIEHKCTKCNEWLEENEHNFYFRNKSKPEKGYSSECKKCASKRSFKYLKEHPEMKYLTQKKYKESPAGRVSGRKTNMKRYSTSMRVWFENNPEKIKEYNKNRQHKNHKISKKEWIACKEYFNNQCAYCGLPQQNHFIKKKGNLLNYDLHKEHVIHEGLNDLSNCVPSCQSCNSQKWKFELEEWYNEENSSCYQYSRERLDKIYKWLNEDHLQYIEIKNFNKI